MSDHLPDKADSREPIVGIIKQISLLKSYSYNPKLNRSSFSFAFLSIGKENAKALVVCLYYDG